MPRMYVPERREVRTSEITIEEHTLTDVVLGGYVMGVPLGEGPVVVIVGGITASPFPFGRPAAGNEPEVEAWWSALRAPDLVDPSTQTVICPCWPGNGSTWKGFDEPDTAIPPLSAIGLADLVATYLRGIGCTRPVVYIGASLGGLVGIAFAVRHPAFCEKLVTISAGLRPDGWGTATRHLQRELVRDGLRNGDVTSGMVRARQLGMLTYRGREELDTRFGKLEPGLAHPPVASYNSVQWPVPRKLSPLPPRRHYLRVTGEPHPGLQRRIDSLARRAGLQVLAHASRNEGENVNHAVVISPSDDVDVSALLGQLDSLGRVDKALWLGVLE